MPTARKLALTEIDRITRMQWWKRARFGMFIHWGLYSQLARHEWVMNRERIPKREYEKLAATWKPKPRPMREWAKLAKTAGMRYLVMTTKHHEGFCLWDTHQTTYNSVKHGPGRDLVHEYVDACREFGLKVGFYYCLMDWHHADGARCAYSESARRRFLDFTQGCIGELMSNYGKIDVLWYDVSWPLTDSAQWESRTMNRMVRKLQPGILINDRSKLPEDFGTPEENVTPQTPGKGRGWEACMTYNGSWGYMPSACDWRSNREVISMLGTCAGFNGNLLLNIGPAPDGSVPEEAKVRLKTIGKWTAKHGEAMYGDVDRIDVNGLERMPVQCGWSIKGKSLYWWVKNWPGNDELTIGGLKTRVTRITNLTTRKRIAFHQSGPRLVMRGLPKACPDKTAGITVFKLSCASTPRQELGGGCVILPKRK